MSTGQPNGPSSAGINTQQQNPQPPPSQSGTLMSQQNLNQIVSLPSQTHSNTPWHNHHQFKFHPLPT